MVFSSNSLSSSAVLTGSLAPLAVVTGSGGGLGAEFAHRLASQGYDLALIDLNTDANASTVDNLRKSFSDCQIINILGDVAAEETWCELINRLEDRPVSLLVNNAGVLHAGMIVDSKAADLRRVAEVNLIGPLLGCQAVVPRLSNSPTAPLPSGILNIASIFASVSPPGFTAYNASKAGVIGLSETLRGELKPKGHQVTVVLPGLVPTGLFGSGTYSSDSYRSQVANYSVNAELTAEQVVSEAINAFCSGRFEVPIGKKASWYWRLKRWMPLTLLDKVAKQAHTELD